MSDNPRKCFLIACTTRNCGETKLLDSTKLADAIKIAREGGWAVRRGGWRCPDCVQQIGEEREESRMLRQAGGRS